MTACRHIIRIFAVRGAAGGGWTCGGTSSTTRRRTWPCAGTATTRARGGCADDPPQGFNHDLPQGSRHSRRPASKLEGRAGSRDDADGGDHGGGGRCGRACRRSGHSPTSTLRLAASAGANPPLAAVRCFEAGPRGSLSRRGNVRSRRLACQGPVSLLPIAAPRSSCLAANVPSTSVVLNGAAVC